jgi:DNA-binding GntR family transcriptional regulator
MADSTGTAIFGPGAHTAPNNAKPMITFGRARSRYEATRGDRRKAAQLCDFKRICDNTDNGGQGVEQTPEPGVPVPAENQHEPLRIDSQSESSRPDADSSLLRLPTNKSITDQVRDAIRSAIISGRLAPGTLHSAPALAVQLGVSRTPVREALLQLAREGAVKFERNRGVRILETSRKDLQEIFQMREWLEAPATGLAAINRSASQLQVISDCLHRLEQAAWRGDVHEAFQADLEFHQQTFIAAGNSRMIRYTVELRQQLGWVELSTRDPRSIEEILQPHVEIYEAIARSDQAAAETLMRKHIWSAYTILLSTADETVSPGWFGGVRSSAPGR